MASPILVINDDQSILDLFGLLLKAEGYEVILSMRTYEDVSDIEQLRPALIILDFKIGHHNAGWLLLQKLRMYHPTKDIPLIICTAALMEVHEQEETLRQKGIPVIYKPFDIDELLLVVQQFLPPPLLRVVEVS
jgi:DNA-binding response OmpR family regulator